VLSITTLEFSNLSSPLGQYGQAIGFSRNYSPPVCFCGVVQMMATGTNSSSFEFEHSSYWKKVNVPLSYLEHSSCASLSLKCTRVQTGESEYVILARGYTTSGSLRDRQGLSVHVPVGPMVEIPSPSLDELQHGVAMDLPPLAAKLSSEVKVASGMILLANGCITVSGCRKLALSKIKLMKDQEACTGYPDQIVSNRTHCVVPPRGHNRQRCDAIKHVRPTTEHDTLWVANYGPYISFQHFVVDKLPSILAAYEMLRENSHAKLLIHADSRGRELVEHLNLNMSKFIFILSAKKKFCAKYLWMDTPLPGKYGLETRDYARPPEIFNELSHAFLRRHDLKTLQSNTRNTIVVLSRDRDKDHIFNFDKVVALVKKRTGMQVFNINTSQMSFAKLSKIMLGARIIIGIHGGQMANIVFARPDRGTAVIEIVGRQTLFKSYYYGGMSAALDYHVIPRLCKTSKGGVIHPVVRTRARCLTHLYVDLNSVNRAVTKILSADLERTVTSNNSAEQEQIVVLEQKQRTTNEGKVLLNRLATSHVVSKTTENSCQRSGVLTVVIGTMRGGAMAWSSLLKYVIEPLRSDLATLGTFESSEGSPLHKQASYRWIVPNESDWGNVLAHAVGCRRDWSKLCKRSRHDEYLGGVKHCHHASGGILFALRYVFSQLLMDNKDLFESYEWIILTRSDFLHTSMFPDVAQLDPRALHMPSGTSYGGYNDRIAIIPKALLLPYFNVTASIVSDWKYYMNLNDERLNFEKVVKAYLMKVGIPVKTFCLNAFTIARPGDKSLFKLQGSTHHKLKKFNVLLKYPKELLAAGKCHIGGEDRMWEDIEQFGKSLLTRTESQTHQQLHN
jgi:hypothetical protein